MKRPTTLFTIGWVGLLLVASFCFAETLYGQVASSSARSLNRWTPSAPYTFSSSARSATITSSVVPEKPHSTHVSVPIRRRVSALGVTGTLQMYDNDSLARVVLVDEQGAEYLVYEAYPGIAKSGRFTAFCLETCLLPNVQPTSLRIELVHAYLEISALDLAQLFGLGVAAAAQRDRIRAAQELEIITALNTHTRGMWTAGSTPLSRMSHADKQKLFGGTVPNLQGFEYYKGGVFSMPSASAPQLSASAFVPKFDWREKHRANDPDSPYYAGDSTGGWMTSIKSQRCAECWAHAANGAVEVGINLFYNRHLNIDLSEQELVSCSGAGSCAYGGNPQAALNYIMRFGVHEDACFPETGRDDRCKLCSAPHDLFTIGGYQDIYSSDGDDNIKQRLIKYGPIVFGISSWWHAMVLVGYDTDAIGQPIWILKNSWGPQWGQNGYAYMTVPDYDMYLMSNQLSPYTSMLHTYTVACRDADNDAYYNWGIGPKPSSCPPTIPEIEDCNDADASVALLKADGSCVVPPPLPVKIEIKPPASAPVPINPASRGRIPVAILSTAKFNAVTRIAISSLSFGRTGNEPSLASCGSGQDANGDGLADLVCHFYNRQTGFITGDTVAFLKGQTVSGVKIKGSEHIRIVRR